MNPTPEQEVHVGIDVSTRILDVCLLPEGESFTLGNDQEGVEELLSRLHIPAPLARGGALPKPIGASQLGSRVIEAPPA